MGKLNTKPTGRYSRRTGPGPATAVVLPSHVHLHLARRLDREADAELGMGHHAAAERLATRAAELRGLGA